jgi:hypothetical protein
LHFETGDLGREGFFRVDGLTMRGRPSSEAMTYANDAEYDLRLDAIEARLRQHYPDGLAAR